MNIMLINMPQALTFDPGRLMSKALLRFSRTSVAAFAVLLALFAGITMVARSEISQHAADHARDDAINVSESILTGIEDRLADLKSVSAFIESAPNLSSASFAAFVRKIKEDGLCELSLVSIGYVTIETSGLEVRHAMPPTAVESGVIDAFVAHPALISTALRIEGSGIWLSEPFKLPGLIEETLVAFVSPVYNNTDPSTSSVGSVQSAGFTFAVHKIEQLVGVAAIDLSLGHDLSENIGLRISDGEQEIFDASLTSNDISDGRFGGGEPTWQRALDFGGRQWSFEFAASNTYGLTRGDRAIVPLLILSGVLISVIGAVMTHVAVRFLERLRARASYHSAHLQRMGSQISHVLDAAKEAQSFASGRTRADLQGNRMLVMALVKEIEIIGEAAYQMEE